jgi:NhaP-type Na+/H+ or K+/H+ antiporter
MKTAYIVILMMSVAFLMNGFEDACNDMIPFASLLAIMTMGMAVRQDDIQVMKKAGPVFEEMWTAAEIFLFVLVGASVALNSLKDCGIQAVLLILLVLVFRVCGVWLCLLKTGLTFREKLFCMISYLPKATVQAAIGGLPLAMGVVSGQLILTVSVAAILLTAPLGAVGIEQTYRHYLSPSCTMETGDNET